MIINNFLNKFPIEEIDYNYLLYILKDYNYPRNKIGSFLAKKYLIRVKKGLYVFNQEFSLEPYIRETLANLIYGPSYISLEYALSFYGLIPEKVETITSITPKRNKYFSTPTGNYSYRYLELKKYQYGINIYTIDEFHNILIASKEKAIIDKLYFEDQKIKDLNSYFFNDLRIDENDFLKLDKNELLKIVEVYNSYNLNNLKNYLKDHI